MTIIDLKRRRTHFPIWLVGVFTFVMMLAFSGVVMEVSKFILFSPNYPHHDRFGRTLYQVPIWAMKFYGDDLWLGLGWYIVNWVQYGVFVAILPSHYYFLHAVQEQDIAGVSINSKSDSGFSLYFFFIRSVF